MKKLAILAIVAVLSFGFVGCASSLERQWGMKENDVGYIQELTSTSHDNDKSLTIYSFTVSYAGRVSEPFRSYDDKLLSGVKLGDEVRMELSHYVTVGGKVVGAWYWCEILETHDPMQVRYLVYFE